MVVSAAKAVLSILPILTILITMLALCWSAARAGVIGLAVTILVAWLGFGYGSAVYPDYPEFAAFLVKAGIDSISLNPDSVVKIKQVVAKAEKKGPADEARLPDGAGSRRGQEKDLLQ